MIGRLQTRARQFVATLLKEGLEPGRAAAAVFLGIFIGIVPIYGFQTLAAVGAAVFFRLNKPLTVAGTFINNPLLQPAIIVASVEIGYFLQSGSFRRFHLSALTGPHIKQELIAFAMGSVVLGVILGGVGAVITAAVIQLKAPRNPELRDRFRFVNGMFARSAWRDRSFVWWKLRLDRIFALLAAEDLGSGTAVDLGCGYGIGLGFVAFSNTSRRLVGRDLDGHRIAVARQSLAPLNADLSVADIRGLELPPAGLILILDVLQYLGADEQMAVLQQCCSALIPEGVLIFRVHDREHGLRSRITMAFDRLIFLFGPADVRPLTLPASEYRSVLQRAGMRVEETRFRNHLPLAHILFIARKPSPEAAI